MITNFENETKDLNPQEKGVALKIAETLRKKIGKRNVVTSRVIIEGMTKHFELPFKIGGARLRKMINWIRINDVVPNLVATANGYYVAETKEELDTYIQSLEERSSAIQAVADKLKEQGKKFNQTTLI